MTFQWFWSLVTWLRGDQPLYVPHWTPEKAQKHERNTLRMLGRGETKYAWSARYAKRKKQLQLVSKRRSA